MPDLANSVKDESVNTLAGARDTTAGSITSGGDLARNIVWNLIGEAAPFAIALVAIPILLKSLGIARFGILTIIWSLITYFGIFDMGLGRAMTKLIADKIAISGTIVVPGLFWTGMLLMAAAGGIGTVITAVGLPFAVDHALRIPPELRTETVRSCYVLALGFPVIISSAGLRGTLAAMQRFDLINLVELPTGALLFFCPLLVLPYSHSLVAIVIALLLVRALNWIITLYFCARAIPGLLFRLTMDRRSVRPLTSFGGWVMVSNVVGPIMVYSDRFFIAAIVSIAAVAYYTTPFELLFRLSIIPSAITAVLFPALAESLLLKRTRALELFDKGSKAILFAIFPILLIGTAFAHRGLDTWLGSTFAAQSTAVMQWLSFGMLINSAAWVAFALIQALDRPDLTAKLHILELLAYIPLLCWLTWAYGVKGAAIAWTLRVLVDTTALLWISTRLVPEIAEDVRNTICLTLIATAALAITIILPASFTMRLIFVASCLITTGIFALPEFEWLSERLRQRNLRSRLLSE